MQPYLAVIQDSFRAAFSSRVLWVALAAIYLFLFSIAPIGYREVFTTTIRWFDISNGTRLKAMLAKDIEAGEKTPAGMIARAMPAEIQDNLRKVAEGQEVRIRLDLLADAMNDLLSRDDWYESSVWRTTNRLREQRELEASPTDSLTPEQKQRLARLRIEAALPGVFESRSSRSMALTYAGFDFPAVFQVDPTQFRMLLNHFVLRIIIDWVLGFVMIFLGILVTASIIPDMLQPGSLHLLLSKPVSRSSLFIAKFIGGCAFVLVCVAQLIIGLWLISGLRLGIWNARLLLCIPVCVFLFAVFYSVSAVAGLRWRSPILSIGLANAFGALCLVIGIIGGVSDGFITEPDRIESMTRSGDTLITATRGGDLRRYDPTTRKWIDLFPENNGGGDRVLAPVATADGLVLTARVRGGRMNLFGSGATALLTLQEQDAWKPQPSIELPAATSQLHTTPQGELVALNTSELLIANAEKLKPGLPAATDAETAQTSSSTNADEPATGNESGTGLAQQWLPKLLKMMGAQTDGFQPLTPRSISLSAPRSVAFAADGHAVFAWSAGRLTRLDRPASPQPNATWQVGAQVDLEGQPKQLWLGVVGDVVVVLAAEQAPRFFDESLAPLERTPLNPHATIDWKDVQSVTACPAASCLAIITTDGNVHRLELNSSGTYSLDAIDGVQDANAAHWDHDTRTLWIAHHVDAVTAINSQNWQVADVIQPSVEGWRLVDRYVVTPLRTITPQTGELGETIATLVSGENTLQLPIGNDAPQTQRYHVWRPVITCAAFIVVMLSVGCVYFARSDF